MSQTDPSPTPPPRAAAEPSLGGRPEGPAPNKAHVPVDGERSVAVTDAERELVAEPPTLCLNCGARLPGAYCPRCGQRHATLRLPLQQFMRDGFAELFGIDGRVWRTYGTLLFKPGRLTTEYFKGRRKRSLSPLRVYIAATLLFFVLLSLIDPLGKVSDMIGARPDGRDADSLVVVRDELVRVRAAIIEADSAAARYADLARDTAASVAAEQRARRVAERAGAAADSLSDAGETWASDDAAVLRAAIDDAVQEAVEDLDEVPDARERLGLRLELAMLQTLPPDTLVRLGDIEAARAQLIPEVNNNVITTLPGWMLRSQAVERFSRARDRDEQRAATMQLGRSAIGQIPTALFLLLPLFALLLKILYVRRGWYYSEHLVFGLHVHAAAFVVLTLALVVSFATGGGGIASSGSPVGGGLVFVLLSYIPVYYLIASWRVYQQGVLKTFVKSVVLAYVYLLFLAVLGVGLTVALAALER